MKSEPFLIHKWLFSGKGEVHKTALSSEELRKKTSDISLENYCILCIFFIDFLADMIMIMHLKGKKK